MDKQGGKQPAAPVRCCLAHQALSTAATSPALRPAPRWMRSAQISITANWPFNFKSKFCQVHAKMSRTLRNRSSSGSSSESRSESVFNVDSASEWKRDTTQYMNIKVRDVQEMFPRTDLPGEANSLILPEWTAGDWLRGVELRTSHDAQSKTLIGKIRKVFLAEEASISEVRVDGFMSSLLSILCFDNYPCFLYPQYNFTAKIGPDSRAIGAKPDFSVLSESDRLMLVTEHKFLRSAVYSNNWKEDQVLGELFAAVHHIVTNSRAKVMYPVTVYAVRIIGTKFTFYKAVAALEYIKESAKLGMSIDNEMVVQRCPPVDDNPSRLTAYDICNKDDRMCILQCLCSIRKAIS